MRMGSLARDFKVIWQARVSDRPVGHRRGTLAALCLCVAMGLTGAPVQAKEPQSRCAQIGHKWADFWNGGEVTKAFDVFTRDIVYEDVTLGVHARGAREFQAFAQSIFDGFPVSSFQVEQSACQGQQGLLDWTWIAEDGIMNVRGSGFCGTGKPFTVRGATILDIQGRRISHNVDFWDLATVLRQLLPEGADCVARLLGLSEPCAERSRPVGPACESLRRAWEGAQGRLLPASAIAMFRIIFCTSPGKSALLRAGDLSDQATFFRNDLLFAEHPTVPKNPHTFLTRSTPGLPDQPIAIGAQQQVATFFASDGTVVIHPEPAQFFEVPIMLPLPEDLNFIP